MMLNELRTLRRSYPSGPAFVGALDDYTADMWTACWTERLLSSWTSPIMRVRRMSDNAEQDFYDAADVGDFCGGSVGIVVRLYDQTGNGRDLYRSGSPTAANTPNIWDGTTLHLVGTRPGMKFGEPATGARWLEMSQQFNPASAELFIRWYRKIDGPNRGGMTKMGSHAYGTAWAWADNTIYDGWGSTVRKALTGVPALAWDICNPNVTNIRSAPSDWGWYLDGVSRWSTTSNTVGWDPAPHPFGRSDATFFAEGNAMGWVMYSTTKSDRVAISAALA